MPDYNRGDKRKPRPPRGPGKGPKARRFQVRLYPKDLNRLKHLIAAGYGRNRSEVIRRLIEEASPTNRT